MLITVTCRCGKQFRVGKDLAGKQCKCKACGRAISIPTLAQLDRQGVLAQKRAEAKTTSGPPHTRKPALPAYGPWLAGVLVLAGVVLVVLWLFREPRSGSKATDMIAQANPLAPTPLPEGERGGGEGPAAAKNLQRSERQPSGVGLSPKPEPPRSETEPSKGPPVEAVPEQKTAPEGNKESDTPTVVPASPKPDRNVVSEPADKPSRPESPSEAAAFDAAMSDANKALDSNRFAEAVRCFDIALQVLSKGEPGVAKERQDKARAARRVAQERLSLFGAAFGEGLTLKGHRWYVNSVAFSPDGKLLASASSDRTIKIWNAQTGKLLGTLQGYVARVPNPSGKWPGQQAANEPIPPSVNSVAFSPDGQLLLAGSDHGMIEAWVVQTGRQVLSFRGHAATAKNRAAGLGTRVIFSPDGKHLASVSADDKINLWHLNGELARTIQADKTIRSAVFSPDGKRLASADMFYNAVRVWDAQTGQMILALKTSSWALAFSPDGRHLAAGSGQGASVWEVETGKALVHLAGHTALVRSVAYNPYGKLLATASSDKTVKVWQSLTGEPLMTLAGHDDWVTCVVFSPDGRRLASASLDKTVRVWESISVK